MKTKLIALVALAMADLAFLAADVAAGDGFEVESTDAEGLLTAGKAKLAEEPPAAVKKGKTIKARVLVGCGYGQPDDLVDIEEAEAKASEKQGLVDTNKAAVAYAAGLDQNKA